MHTYRRPVCWSNRMAWRWLKVPRSLSCPLRRTPAAIMHSYRVELTIGVTRERQQMKREELLMLRCLKAEIAESTAQGFYTNHKQLGST